MTKVLVALKTNFHFESGENSFAKRLTVGNLSDRYIHETFLTSDELKNKYPVKNDLSGFDYLYVFHQSTNDNALEFIKEVRKIYGIERILIQNL